MITGFLVILQTSSASGPSFVTRRKRSPRTSPSSGVQGFVVCFFSRFQSCCSRSGFRQGRAAREETSTEGESLCVLEAPSFVRESRGKVCFWRLFSWRLLLMLTPTWSSTSSVYSSERRMGSPDLFEYNGSSPFVRAFAACADPRPILDCVGLQFGKKNKSSGRSRAQSRFAFRPDICCLCWSTLDLWPRLSVVWRKKQKLEVISTLFLINVLRALFAQVVHRRNEQGRSGQMRP